MGPGVLHFSRQHHHCINIVQNIHTLLQIWDRQKTAKYRSLFQKTCKQYLGNVEQGGITEKERKKSKSYKEKM